MVAFRLLLGLWILPAVGCGPGNSSNPTAPSPQIIPAYSAPTLTLETLAKGIEDKGQSNGQSVYLGAFAESTAVNLGDGRAYHAFFDPRDLRDHPSWDPNRDWNKDLERVMYVDLARKFVNPYEMTWEPYEPNGNETGGPDDSLLHRKYTIVQLIQAGSTVTRSPVAIGAVDLYFVRSAAAANKWVIALWQDIHTWDRDSAKISLGTRRLETQ